MSLLNAKEAAAHLGISQSLFHKLRKQRRFQNCLAKEPLGQKKYIAEQLDVITAGESTHRFKVARSA